VDRKSRIMISRTDSIGDVILTLPMARVLKKAFPEATILFLGKNYTRDVVNLSSDIDEFVSWDEIDRLSSESDKIQTFKKLKVDIMLHVFPSFKIARLASRAHIPKRIGASGRLYHFVYCNKIVPMSRKNSPLHEAQLNLKLLKPIINERSMPSLEEIEGYYHLHSDELKDVDLLSLIDPKKFNLVLHPKSKGSAREWPLGSYSDLINQLPDEKFKIFITGTQEEGKLIQDFLLKNKGKVIDLTGKFTLKKLIAFIRYADGLVAASTGPLHLAAMLGKLVVGIYPPIRPMHPGRWAPVGKNAQFLVANKICEACRKNRSCDCMDLVSVDQVKKLIEDYVGRNY